ncbi:hypothetical protein [Brevibacillus nitrificans]|uniref:hypothetical protein n=1 Tax=Brevibacillus nitrificans TaxID=651560 RepID=UPI00262F71AD|nr:hypothetical protein [Brevibacillus nitrificans]MED1795859.1 hypothetical protein [Brevibacillus nitrificans]
MTTGFLVVVVIIFVLIIGSTLWVTNKAYSRKSERIDPLPGKEGIQKELDH